MPLARLAVVDAQRRAPGAETEIRTTPMFSKRFRSDKGSDPIAELARLIAQADTHEGRAPSNSLSREEAVSDSREETPELPPAPQLAVNLNVDDQASERDERCSDDRAYDVDDDLRAGEEQYQNSEILRYVAGEHHGKEVSRVRRHRLALAMAVFGVALVGTVCAVGYRDMLGGPVSSTPPRGIQTINERNAIASVSGPQGANSGKPREVDPTITGSIDNTVAHEDRPAAVRPSKAAPRASLPLASATATTGGGQTASNRAVARAAVPAPAPRLTVAAAPEGPGQSGGENDVAVSNHERLATDPLAHASSDTSAAAAAVASSYAAQVTSERSESRAQAVFRLLQAKYPNQLGGHQLIIRRADLGAGGIYYRALVGPFASAEKAAKLCRALRAAGGNCIVQKLNKLGLAGALGYAKAKDDRVIALARHS
jgi:SPOR domain